jgi:hypothetical protein
VALDPVLLPIVAAAVVAIAVGWRTSTLVGTAILFALVAVILFAQRVGLP